MSLTNRMEINLTYTADQEKIFFDWQQGIKYKIVRKGRRSGLTKGAANAFIDYMIQGITPLLWGDTVLGNIQRYFERYFEPELKNNNIPYTWSSQSKQLKIGQSYCDFRSEDQPQNWEGFGYKIIFLNEAGIILKNKYLYTNAVLPMLMDYPDSKLIAGGVPKGKKTKEGHDHVFWKLWQRGEKHPENYQLYALSSYDNPFLGNEDVRLLEDEINAMSPAMVRQEIYGEFIDAAILNPFATSFDLHKHVDDVFIREELPLFLSIDFNLNPFALIAAHIYADAEGIHCHVVDEVEIKQGSIEKMITEIKNRYGRWFPTLQITGDYSGSRRDIGQVDNASYYDQIERAIGLRSSQIRLYPNPQHSNSRADVNKVLFSFPDFKIARNCKNTIFDFQNVECDAFGSIIKRNRNDLAQRGDYLDTERYLINAFLHDWIKKNKL